MSMSEAEIEALGVLSDAAQQAAGLSEQLSETLRRVREVANTPAGARVLRSAWAPYATKILEAAQAVMRTAQVTLEVHASERFADGGAIAASLEVAHGEREGRRAGTAAAGSRSPPRAARRTGRGAAGAEMATLTDGAGRAEEEEGEEEEGAHAPTDRRHPGSGAALTTSVKAQRHRFTDAEDAIFEQTYREMAPRERSLFTVARQVRARLPHGMERKERVVYKHLLLLKEKHKWSAHAGETARMPHAPAATESPQRHGVTRQPDSTEMMIDEEHALARDAVDTALSEDTSGGLPSRKTGDKKGKAAALNNIWSL